MILASPTVTVILFLAAWSTVIALPFFAAVNIPPVIVALTAPYSAPKLMTAPYIFAVPSPLGVSPKSALLVEVKFPPEISKVPWLIAIAPAPLIFPLLIVSVPC